MAQWLHFMEHKLLRNLSKYRVVLDEAKLAAASGVDECDEQPFILYRRRNVAAVASNKLRLSSIVSRRGCRMATNWRDNVNEMSL